MIENALSGKFQQTFAIFTAKNIAGMRDVQETVNETNVTVTGFEKLPDDKLSATIKKYQAQLGEGIGGEIETAIPEPD